MARLIHLNGPPGIGKSTLARRHGYAGFDRLNHRVARVGVPGFDKLNHRGGDDPVVDAYSTDAPSR